MGKKPSPQEAVDVLCYLIELGIEELVASMLCHFSPRFIVDFVAISRLYGDCKDAERFRDRNLGNHDIFADIRRAFEAISERDRKQAL
jgi:hypothetical protein